MRTKESMLRIFILIFLASILSACANVSRFEKSSLVAFGQLLDDSNEPLYYLFRIDLKNSANPRIMGSQLKLSPDSPPIALVEMRPEFVASYLPPFIPPPQWPEAWKLKSKEQQVYAGNGLILPSKKANLSSLVSVHIVQEEEKVRLSVHQTGSISIRCP
ncbi:hypothetical protein [Marinobacterium zhoushanense]|uniref:hypothetical protein n=1 Tax=Marinobacterium zhoushanense TaxID=1679163 RepID=UPI001665E974|nr:hypothetical protein [Marinobacterium zhoushanense]